MKLWIGGEIQADIAENFRHARMAVEEAINKAIESKSYELPLNSWDCIAVVRDDENFQEITRYSKKKQDMDFRLHLDFKRFKEGPQTQRERLICEMLNRSLIILEEKGLPSAGLNELRLDLKRTSTSMGWS